MASLFVQKEVLEVLIVLLSLKIYFKIIFKWSKNIMWTKPEYTEMRFGFEVTMYIANR
tara:strand:- start:347 stop:520 length:174 start_codon:yes stop_codon:yes gene_type:complete